MCDAMKEPISAATLHYRPIITHNQRSLPTTRSLNPTKMRGIGTQHHFSLSLFKLRLWDRLAAATPEYIAALSHDTARTLLNQCVSTCAVSHGQ